MSIRDLAKHGAAIMSELRGDPHNVELRAQLAEIARDIEQGWTIADIERVEPAPAYIRGAAMPELEGFVKLHIRGTNGHVSVSQGWGHRYVNFVFRRHQQ